MKRANFTFSTEGTIQKWKEAQTPTSAGIWLWIPFTSLSVWHKGILSSHLVNSCGKVYGGLYFQLLNFHWYFHVLYRHTDLDQVTNMLDTTEQKDLWTLPEWYWFSGFRRKLLRGCQQAVKKSEQWTAFPRGAQTSFLYWSIWAGGSPTFYQVDF